MYFRTCRSCGAHIDPGERCDCGRREKPVETKKEGSSTSGAECHDEEGRRLFKDTA